MPWAALIPLAAPWAWRHRREPWLRLLAGWVIPFWLILEAVPTKLPHYVLPLYPALIIVLAGWAMAEDRGAPSRRLNWISAMLSGLPGVVLAIAVLALPLALEGALVWPALPLALVAASAAIFAAKAALAARPMAQIGASIIAAMALYPAILQFAFPALETAFPSPRIAALIAEWRPCARGSLITTGYREPSLVFLTETGTVLAGADDAARSIASDSGAMVLVETRLLETFDAALPEGMTLIERGRVEYFNYNRGKRASARLLTRDDPRWQACAQ